MAQVTSEEMSDGVRLLVRVIMLPKPGLREVGGTVPVAERKIQVASSGRYSSRKAS